MAKRSVKEIHLKGIIASPGIAIGACFVHQLEDAKVARKPVSAAMVDSEVARLNKAIKSASLDVEKIHKEADKRVGNQLAKIFEAELLILADTEFFSTVAKDIRRNKLNAEYAYQRHVQKTINSLSQASESYLQEMADDIKATSERVMSYLMGTISRRLVDNKQKIALSNSFSPGEIVLMSKYRTPGFAVENGGPTSHMILVARSLSIPAVVGINGLLRRTKDGSTIIIDGYKGQVICNPAEKTIAEYKDLKRKRRSLISRQFKGLARIAAKTLDDRVMKVCANIDFPSNTDKILSAGDVSVGLYRTEFFYLSGLRFPSEEEQTKSYHNIAQMFSPNIVTLRVYDLGSDKVKNDHERAKEINPALGWRGIRYNLDSPDIFKSQIRAILRASELGNIRIMLPMISTTMEIIKAKRMIHAAMKELHNENIQFDEDIPIGIMVEVPSAALTANDLARHVDFFSIGTNDLVQYTLAVDRGNKKLASLYQELHPGVLKLIKMTIDAGAAANIPVAMCGELAGNLIAIPLLVGLGLTEFSVNPLLVPEAKKTISKLFYGECRVLADRVMKLPTTEKVKAVLRDWYINKFGEL